MAATNAPMAVVLAVLAVNGSGGGGDGGTSPPPRQSTPVASSPHPSSRRHLVAPVGLPHEYDDWLSGLASRRVAERAAGCAYDI